MNMAKVYVASMKMRGKWAERTENSTVVNVTSMQRKSSQFRKDFSPMSEIKGGYKGFYCFENYWQAGKVFDHLSDEKGIEKYVGWWKNLEQGKRRYPKSKDKKVLHSDYDGKKRDYIDSRKEIYVSEYYELIKNSESLKKCKRMLKEGKTLVVYDLDGRKKEDGDNDCLLVAEGLLREKINDPTFPFGHGYVVAGAIFGIIPEDYVV